MAGLLAGAASGLEAGLDAYFAAEDRKADKKRADDEALARKKSQQADFLLKGIAEKPDGTVDFSDDERQRRMEEREATKSKGLLDTSRFELDALDKGYKLDRKAEGGYGFIADPTSHRAQERALELAGKRLANRKLQADMSKPVSNKERFDALPMGSQKQVEKLAMTAANKKQIANTLESGLRILDDKKVSPDQKLVQAQSMIKALNSTEGADAVGAEESKRLASLLEVHIFNLTQPGPIMGRAPISEFAKQVRNKLGSVRDAARLDEEEIERLTGGGGSAPAQGLLEAGGDQQQKATTPDEDAQALAWAQANPSSAEAQEILRVLGKAPAQPQAARR